MVEQLIEKRKNNRKRIFVLFFCWAAAAVGLLLFSHIKVLMYNAEVHHESFKGSELFSDGIISQKKGVFVTAVPRGSTWTKTFDLDDEGLDEPNFQAFTYDFTVSNNTKDELAEFSFKVTIDQEAFLSSAWNGALEIHQDVNGSERSDTIPDLRDYQADDYSLETVIFDGETLITMKAGDYFIYLPSTSTNALEMPIEPMEATTPGIILYLRIGESFEDSTSLELDYYFHRVLASEPLYWVSVVALLVWLIALIVYAIIRAQIRKYTERHERDNEIINESIETFTGFIDAKDPYTNGHSKRVAMYTRQIADVMGYSGEELDRIYYIALLHDCGKIGVPDNILRKPGKLTDEEFKIIQSHTVRGGEILKSFKSLKNVGEGALYHHERYDGRGYPEGLSGENIPLIARMICVADSFDAMNSNRVYRKKLTKDYIINEIESNKGRQFDPQIADIMLELLRSGKIAIEE